MTKLIQIKHQFTLEGLISLAAAAVWTADRIEDIDKPSAKRLREICLAIEDTIRGQATDPEIIEAASHILDPWVNES